MFLRFLLSAKFVPILHPTFYILDPPFSKPLGGPWFFIYFKIVLLLDTSHLRFSHLFGILSRSCYSLSFKLQVVLLFYFYFYLNYFYKSSLGFQAPDKTHDRVGKVGIYVSPPPLADRMMYPG